MSGGTTTGRPILERWGPPAAWSLLLVAVLCLGGVVLLGSGNAAHVAGSTSGVEILWVLSWLGFGLVGTLLAHRRPRNTIGWILLGIPLVICVTLFLSEYAIRGLVVAPGSLPLALAAGWVSKWSFAPGLGLVLALLLVYPTGRIHGRWMQRLAVVLALLLTAMTVLLAIEPLPIRGDVEVMNPLGVTAFGDVLVTLTYVVGYSIAAIAVAIGADVVRRYRRSRGLERQQFRWFASSVAAFPVLFVTTVLVSDTIASGWSWDPVVLAFFFGMNGIAAAIGVAVTRYKLYEIDRVVSRTVAYAIVTAFLVGIYALSVVTLSGIVRGIGGEAGGDLVVAASTLVVAAAFGPLRRRVQAIVDRRFNRSRYDAQRTAEAFGQRLRDEVELVRLAHDLQAVVAEAVRPVRISLWLRPTEAGEAT